MSFFFCVYCYFFSFACSVSFALARVSAQLYLVWRLNSQTIKRHRCTNYFAVNNDVLLRLFFAPRQKLGCLQKVFTAYYRNYSFMDWNYECVGRIRGFSLKFELPTIEERSWMTIYNFTEISVLVLVVWPPPH